MDRLKSLETLCAAVLVLLPITLFAQEESPITQLVIYGNTNSRLKPGESLSLVVSSEVTGNGLFELVLADEIPPFVSDWDSKEIDCRGTCVLEDTLTLTPTIEDCGSYTFKVRARFTQKGQVVDRSRRISVSVIPRMEPEPPFTRGEANTLCWSDCRPLEQTLFFFPQSGKRGGTPHLIDAQPMPGLVCKTVEQLDEGVRYGYYVDAKIRFKGTLVGVRSDTVFSVQDNSPPPDAAIQQFTVSADGAVQLRWPKLEDSVSFVERYVILRKELADATQFAAVDTLPFFPVSQLSPQNYFPIKARAGEQLYLDSDNTIVKLPDAVKGSTLIKTALHDLWNETDDFLSFRLEVPAEIFVAVDARMESFPTWLKRNFRQVPRQRVATSNESLKRLVLYKSKQIFQPGRVALGGNFASGARNRGIAKLMYVVFVQPVGVELPFQARNSVTYTDRLSADQDLKTFQYQIQSIDAAGNVSDGVASGPVVLDLQQRCKPVAQKWFDFQRGDGEHFARGTGNAICVVDPNSQPECQGFRRTDSLRFQAVRENVELFSSHGSKDEGVNFFDSGWVALEDLPSNFCFEFDLQPPGKDRNFVNDQRYFYRVRGKDVHGNVSAWSDTVSAIQDAFPPGDISNLEARTEFFADGDDGCIELSWRAASDPVSGVLLYEIFRSDDGGQTFSAVGQVPATQTVFCDTLSRIGENKIVQYKVSVRDNVGNVRPIDESAQEVALRALVGPVLVLDEPATFTCPSGVPGVKRDSLRLAWRDFNATGAQGYEVEIVEPSGRVTVKTLNDPQTKESVCPLSAGDGTYRFRVRAFYADGQRTAFSNTLTVRKKVTLHGVVDLAVTQAASGSGDIVLRWSHPDGDEIEAFEIFTWSEGETQPEQPTVILPGDSLVWVQSFSESGLVAYRCNFYLVRARDCFGLISRQNPVVTQFSAPAPRFDPAQTAVTENSITVCWNRPEPRLKPDDTFDAVVLVHRDSLNSPAVDSVRFFNKSCFTLLNPEPGHNYIFQVKEVILDDLQQSCSDEFASVFARPLVVPFDNRPPAVSFVVQPLPVLPGSDEGRIFVSWEGFANRAVHRFLVKWHTAGSVTADSAEVVDADTLLVTGLDASQRYEFSVIAIDSLGQRSEGAESRTADFSPRWTFTPRVLGFTPGCFRDSVRVAWTWVDENLNPVASTLGADSVTVELSIDPNFVFKKTAVKLPVQKEYVFQQARHYPFVNDQNDKLYARVRAEDRWQHVSPWSNEYAELGSAAGDFDALPPAVIAASIDSVKAPVLGGPGTVDVFLRWQDAPDNCSGTWFYEIARDQKVIARDTSRTEMHFFVDRDLTSDINLLSTTWEIHAVDSVGNRQAVASAVTVPFFLQPPDSGGCLNDTTFCWSPGSASIPDIELTYVVEGARFPELFGNALTNIVFGPVDSLCVNFNVPWENVFWRVKTRVGEFESAWSDTFVCALQNQTVSAVDGQVGGALPQAFDLAQNYPNPFNPTTTIRYAIPTSVANGARVVLEIFNIAGQRVRTLLDAEKQPGEYVAIWDGRDDSGRAVGSGVYVYRLRVKAFVASHKMILMK